jgi:biopolymer transport protein TolR
MKESHRTRRMQRHHKRNKQHASLNMVSLMDIFTILVFFLLVSATDQETMPSMKDIKLPEATSEAKPKTNIVILVSNDKIMIQGRDIVSARKAIAGRESLIPELLAALNEEAQKKVAVVKDEKVVKQRGVTIMGDKEIPYVLLKKIMLTCASTEFTNISLAVLTKEPLAEKS